MEGGADKQQKEWVRAPFPLLSKSTLVLCAVGRNLQVTLLTLCSELAFHGDMFREESDAQKPWESVILPHGGRITRGSAGTSVERNTSTKAGVCGDRQGQLPAFQLHRQDEQEFGVTLGYILSSKPVWATWDPVSQNRKKV